MTHRTFAQCILGILLAVCLGVYFYAQWDMKRFDASLPKSPAADTIVETPMETVPPEETSAAAPPAGEPPAGHWHGDVWHEEPHTAEPAPSVQPVRSEPQRFVYRAPHEITKDNINAEGDKVIAEAEALAAEAKELSRAFHENRLSTEEFYRRVADGLRRLNANRERSIQLGEIANRLYGGKNE